MVAIVLLVLAILAGVMSYAGYLVVGVVADHLGTGRVMAGLLLGVLFARLPSIREGKLRTVGLLPKRARLPVLLAILALCLLSFTYRGDWMAVLFIGLAAALAFAYRWIGNTITSQFISPLFKSPAGPVHPSKGDDRVIDVEFRERKD